MIKKNIKMLIDVLVEYTKILGLSKTIKTNVEYNIYKTNYKHTFFGYYDKSPFNNNNTKLLAIGTNYDDKLTSEQEASIGYFDIETKIFKEIGKTTTWCWQQGCRLMWFNDMSFIFNKVVDNDYGSVVYDIEKQEEIKEYNFAIYDKTTDNKLALSLNFSRLQYFRPGYGYCNFLKEEDKKSILETDGIYLCSLENNTKKLLIPLLEIISIENDERMDDAEHYINHLKFSPDNKTFLFYHIWNKNNKRHTRAIFANIKGEIIKVIDNKTFMSHYTFKNSKEVLMFTKVIQNGYYLYNLDNKNCEIIYNNLQEDGHQSYINSEDILTDTYPNKFTRDQKIIIFNKNKLINIAKLYSPLRYNGEVRCDLHPRLSEDKKLICVDSPTFNGRNIVVLKLDIKEHDYVKR